MIDNILLDFPGMQHQTESLAVCVAVEMHCYVVLCSAGEVRHNKQRSRSLRQAHKVLWQILMSGTVPVSPAHAGHVLSVY